MFSSVLNILGIIIEFFKKMVKRKVSGKSELNKENKRKKSENGPHSITKPCSVKLFKYPSDIFSLPNLTPTTSRQFLSNSIPTPMNNIQSKMVGRRAKVCYQWKCFPVLFWLELHRFFPFYNKALEKSVKNTTQFTLENEDMSRYNEIELSTAIASTSYNAVPEIQIRNLRSRKIALENSITERNSEKISKEVNWNARFCVKC